MATPTLLTLDSSLVSLIILGLIYYNAYNRSEKVFVQYKLFMALLQTNIALLIIDILGWAFNGLPGTFNQLANTCFNLLLYICEPIGPLVWLLYADFQINQEEERLARLQQLAFALFGFNAFLSVVSVATGWFFTVDGSNIYHRGQYFWLHVLFCYALLAYSFGYILKHRQRIEKRYYYSLLGFYVPQAIGTTIQVFYYGVSYNWTGMMLSMLIIYFNLQDRGLNTDYLTGVYNRRQLDNYIKAKIRNSMAQKSFAAILIDLNEFKQINDKCGHDMGDDALKQTVLVVRQCLRPSDFIARYGGDEFFVLLDIDKRPVLEQTVKRIREATERFNREKHKPYRLSFSMGYDVYDCKQGMQADEFFRHIDVLMYKDKRLGATTG